MVTIPRGEPRSVPDSEGELYDEWVRRKRAAELAVDGVSAQRWGSSPARLEAQDALTAPIKPINPRDVPVTGPAIRAYEAVRDNRPLDAVGDAILFATDVAGALDGVTIVRAGLKGIADNVGVRTGEAVRKQFRNRGAIRTGEQLHHSFELNGIPRTVENWRNHPAFLKILKTDNHKRLRGKSGQLPRYSPIQAAWVGTPSWMKTVPAWVGVHSVDGLLPVRPFSREGVGQPPAPYGERPLR